MTAHGGTVTHDCHGSEPLLLVVHPRELVIAGLKAILTPSFKVVAHSSEGWSSASASVALVWEGYVDGVVGEVCHPGVVAIVTDRREDNTRYLLDQGCCGFVCESDPANVILASVKSATIGCIVMPVAATRKLLGQRTSARDAIDPLERERSQLASLLATGCTVAAIAESIGYSERETYRRLRLLYRALGVSSRYEAISILSKQDLRTDLSTARPRSRSESHTGLHASTG